MKTLSSLIILLFSCAQSYSQISNSSWTCFEYDQAGNRVTRSICTLNQLRSGFPEEEMIYSDKINSNAVTLYPNPTIASVQVKIDDMAPDQKAEIKVYGSDGTLIYSTSGTNPLFTIDLSAQPQGFYNCNIYIGNKPSFWRIIKQ